MVSGNCVVIKPAEQTPASLLLLMELVGDLLPPGVTFQNDFGKPSGFGAGGFVTLEDVPGGPMTGTYGWSGAASTQAWVDPGRQTRGVIMLNINPYNVVDVRTPVIAALAQDAVRLHGAGAQ